MIDWQLVTEKKGVHKDCLGTNQELKECAFVRSLERWALIFFWKMNLDDFKGEKMMKAVCAALFSQRLKKYGDVGYGQENPNRRLAHPDRIKVKLSMFDESDPRQHQMKILFGCGAKFGFRGSKEHVFLELRHVRKGEFEVGHLLEGMTYYGFGGF